MLKERVRFEWVLNVIIRSLNFILRAVKNYSRGNEIIHLMIFLKRLFWQKRDTFIDGLQCREK